MRAARSSSADVPNSYHWFVSDQHQSDLAGGGVELRRAGSDDADLIERTLCLAVGWRGEAPPSPPDGLDAYFADWMRPDDIGVVAFWGIEFAGGAYARRVGPADGTYGFVAPDLAELTIGVEADRRQQGIGQILLATLKAYALERGLAGISLSVEPDNPARRLYETARFETIEERDGDVLMAWRT